MLKKDYLVESQIILDDEVFLSDSERLFQSCRDSVTLRWRLDLQSNFSVELIVEHSLLDRHLTASLCLVSR